jgi:hypothetical protein
VHKLSAVHIYRRETADNDTNEEEIFKRTLQYRHKDMEQVDQQGFEKGRMKDPVKAAEQYNKDHHPRVEACGNYGQLYIALDIEIDEPEYAVHRNNEENEKTSQSEIRLILFGIHVLRPP